MLSASRTTSSNNVLQGSMLRLVFTLLGSIWTPRVAWQSVVMYFCIFGAECMWVVCLIQAVYRLPRHRGTVKAYNSVAVSLQLMFSQVIPFIPVHVP